MAMALVVVVAVARTVARAVARVAAGAGAGAGAKSSMPLIPSSSLSSLSSAAPLGGDN